MRSITCQGTPSEIGLQHGQQAKSEIQGSIEFYNDLFKKKCSMDWQGVCRTAAKFIPLLELRFRKLAYGMFSDGCTAFSWKSKTESFLGQNWDWDKAQSPNLVSMHIRPSQPSKPSIHMITEAGIIGKIGLNSCGVGVTLNAIKCAGVDFNKIPCHLALRTVLNSSSRAEAVEKLEKLGVASACHILVADHTGFDAMNRILGDEKGYQPESVVHPTEK
ncbi:acyl-CoA [Coccidioides immitis RMSCC 3703]|uniref:Acyl-CoA n=1 Tax=Coccidioides immitis RMSCC 3703 TaxID=454286 RepID=A0A0J8QV99_COCIT|nr:acyl-CoA [Coccidioides immitis RMSCC 3703]